jgi:hypothetical protein
MVSIATKKSSSTITFSQKQKELEKSVAAGLDIILSPFQEPVWPRTISTERTDGRQIPVYNKPEALAWYKAANFLDCRISAYPYDSSLGKICDRQIIDFVMIDLDLKAFESKLALDRALSKSLRKIKEVFGFEFESSTIIWRGNGYHIHLPIEARYILEDRPEFSKLNEEPSKQFLRFTEWYLSDGKADPDHYNSVSFGNYLLRIPGSHNFKCVEKNNNVIDSSSQVVIIKQWKNGKTRAPIYLLIGSFLAYLVDQKIKKEEYQRRRKQFSNSNHLPDATIPWIEKLLQIPIDDYRKKFSCPHLSPVSYEC